jgi:hypothetical protein
MDAIGSFRKRTASWFFFERLMTAGSGAIDLSLAHP